ncbi:MAG: hypothetical protein H6983_02570 [Ectothiorhodospiraceae bacterium]|nr:hypothetical protein [Ectothiorhodospiraceae bacterium]
MSGLAHFLEDEGLSTVLVALVREHAEKVRPPRALAVPFALGRPFGNPYDAGFQLDVARAALGLLDHAGERPLLVEYPHDDASESGDPHWVPPALVAAGIAEEVAALAELHAEAIAARGGRSTVGVSGISVESAAAYLDAFATPGQGEPPRRDLAPVSLARFAADDVKAFVTEAAACGGTPSARQLTEWLWQRSATGRGLRALRERLLASDDKDHALLARWLIPRVWI